MNTEVCLGISLAPVETISRTLYHIIAKMGTQTVKDCSIVTTGQKLRSVPLIIELANLALVRRMRLSRDITSALGPFYRLQY